MAPKYVHFLAGYQRGVAHAHARAARYEVAPGFEPARWADPRNLPHDWALIVLKRPIGRKAGYLGWRALTPDTTPAGYFEGRSFALAGYPRDRAHAVSLDPECRPLRFLALGGGVDAPPLLAHRCTILGGDSGAPIAVETGEGPGRGLRVVAINSAADVGLENGRTVNTAVPLMAPAAKIADLRAATQDGATGGRAGAPGRPPAE